ncbi:MAG: hypothetical protein HY070_10815 [Chloroflexi bacterium]|nr:hypothetical protein [Chloroflexota bacterium]
MQSLKGIFLTLTGFLACPCHLPITFPLALTLTAGTALGAFLANNVWLIVAGSTIYFVGAIAFGLRYLSGEKFCRTQNPAEINRSFQNGKAL